ncbi:MAG TPA: response regulator [Nitrososphaeraceae archaeon]|nr:response regulator [Nitrososphaeraceae archaeon]
MIFIVIVQNYAISLDNKKRILVVDDEPDICLVLKIVLEKAGFLADYYYNAILALDEFKSNFYDLIILDIQMPDINGLQLCREIRKRDKKVKICFLTATETIFDIEYKFTPVYTFIRKPIENKELIRIINDLLNN